MPFPFLKKSNPELERFALFAKLDEKERERLSKVAKKLQVKSGKTIFSEKSPGEAFYIISRGKVEISKIGLDGRKRSLSVLGEGELLGELSVLDNNVRSATATALEETTLLSFSGEALQQFVQSVPEIVQLLLETQMARLRKMNDRMLKMEETQRVQERIINTIEEERKRIARDVHDGPKQIIATLILKLDQAEMALQTEPAKAAQKLSEAKQKLQEALKSIRQFIFDLHPLTLKSKGLEQSLQELAERWEKEKNLVITLSGSVPDLPYSVATVFYAIAQEAITNIAKHAQATEVVITLEANSSKAKLSIRDNGKGFPVQEVRADYESRGSLGLVGMEERAKLLNGTFHLESAPGRGTEIAVEVPYE